MSPKRKRWKLVRRRLRIVDIEKQVLRHCFNEDMRLVV